MPFPNPETQFKPGQSGNPAGRPPRRRQIDDLLDLIDEGTEGTERQISRAWLKAILAGEIAHLREYLDRRDGPVPKNVNQDGKTEVLVRRVDSGLASAPPEPGEGEE